MTTRAAIYLRQSRDFTGEELAITRQRADCHAIAKARGWRVVGEYVDNDRSASDRRKERPEYDRLVNDFKAGEFDALVCWDLDRLTRQPRQLEDWIEAAEERGLKIVTANGEADLTTDAGVMFAGIKAQVARAEVRRKSARQARANRERATQGKHFGTRRCFGFELDGVTLRPVEADAIREAFDYVEAGGSLREVARRWNAAGLRGPQKGAEWSGATVSRTLRLPRLAGMRTYRGEVVRGDDGEPVPVEWPAIVDRDQWLTVQAILNDPSRKSTPERWSPLLLSGIATCADCGAPIQSGGTRIAAGGVLTHRYRCSQKGGHVYREAEPIDAYIEDEVVARFNAPNAAEVFQAKPDRGPDVAQIRAEVEALHGRMRGLAEMFSDGAITDNALRAGTARARARVEELEASIPLQRSSPAIRSLVKASNVRGVWRALSTEEQRTVVRVLFRVVIHAPGTKERASLVVDGRKVANPETVEVEWI